MTIGNNTQSRYPASVFQQAAFVVSDMLADRASVAEPLASKQPCDALLERCETDTSKDMRDNWCVGYTDRFTVASG